MFNLADSLSNRLILVLLTAGFLYCICSGGAERLVVDAAVELTALGHHVHIFTAHHDRKRCFEETVDGMSFLVIILKCSIQL